MTTTKPQSTTEEPTNASGKPLFPETLTMVACDQCDEAGPWPLRCGHTYVGIHSREYARLSPASAAPSKPLPPEDMTDDELREAIDFHSRQVARFKNEAAKVWRLRLRINNGTPIDQQMLAELQERRASRVSSASAAPVVDVKQQIADFLNEDRCMFCGGKTEHEPDCDHGVPAAAIPQKSLLREPVRIDVPPTLVVTRDGVPCPDQAAALEEFKEACRSAAAATAAPQNETSAHLADKEG